MLSRHPLEPSLFFALIGVKVIKIQIHSRFLFAKKRKLSYQKTLLNVFENKQAE